MCRHFKRDKEEERPKENEYDEYIDKFFNKVNHISDNLAEATKRIASKSRDFEMEKWSQFGSSMNKEVDSFFNRPYQTRTGPALDNSIEPSLFRPFSFFDVFGDGGAETPFGLYSYSAPTTREYNKCMSKDGLSLWDSKGTWRCLFPNSAVPPKFLEYKNSTLADKILTREDFESASYRAKADANGAIDLGDKGIFFKQFEDLMKWKNVAFESEKMRREERRRRYAESANKSSNTSNYSNFNASESNFNATQQEYNKPVSWSSGSTSTTDPENNQVVVTETKTEYFPDGSSVTNTVTKKKTIGSDKWETVEEKSHRGEDKKGWFWN